MCSAETEAAEMKENRGLLSLSCADHEGNCVYGKYEDDKFPKMCSHMGSNGATCTSKVAMVNKIVLEYKKFKGENDE